jgi:hypothetical protein
MNTSTRTSWAVGLLGIVLGLTLGGCGSSSSQPGAGSTSKKKVMHAQTLDPGSRAPDDMVAAVSAGKPGPPIALKFEVRETPKAGEALDVDIAVLPDAPAINRIYGRFQTGDGLELVEGGQLGQVDKPAAGSIIRHVVRVLPKQDGIYALTATLSVDQGDDSLSRVFSIPVIVGDGLPESTAKAQVTAGQAAEPGTNSKTH